MKAALRAKESRTLAAIRLIVAAIKQKEVDDRVEASDEQVISVLDRMLKQRKEAIAQFEMAKRDDLVETEEFEISVIEKYLPPRMGEDEVVLEVERALAESGATGAKDIGKVMAQLKAKLSGRADMAVVSRLVKARLQP